MASIQSVILKYLIRKTVNWNKPLAELRKDFEKIGGRAKIPNGIEVSSISANGVKAEWIVPSCSLRDKVIVYIHGGGYCLGIYNSNRGFVSHIASQTKIRILLADYRLAPENPYPAAIEDCITLYKWLIDEGYTPQNIIIMGDSSGCGLALSSLTTLRDQGVPMPAALVFMFPTVDFTYRGQSLKSRADFDPFNLDPKFYVANNYVADNDPEWPLISPLYAKLHNLPPMLIHGCGYDIFLSDSTRLAERAREAGVEAELRVWDKMWHTFHMQYSMLPEGRAALREIYNWIGQRIA